MTTETAGVGILCLVAGAAVGWLAASLRKATQLRALAEERARAQQAADRVPELERRMEEAASAGSDLRAKLAETAKENENERSKNEWLVLAEARLRDAFNALAADALRGNNEQFATLTREQFVMPLEKGLKSLDEQVRRMEEKREGAYSGLDERLGHLKEAYEQLRTTAGALATALTTSSGARGEWGEMQMRRLVEMAGMVRHVDFEEQEHAGDGRPDMKIYLPNKGILPVDAKTTMKTYLDAAEAADYAARKVKLQAHAAAVKNRVRELGGKEYWNQFDFSPDFVAMFVPHEAFLSAALEGDPDIFEYAFAQSVLIVTPVTLLALLKTVAYAWQQQDMVANTREIAAQARELVGRIAVFIGHLQKAGKGLDAAVRAYNDAAGSLNSRVMPAAARLRDLGAGGAELPRIEAVDRRPNLPAGEENEEKG